MAKYEELDYRTYKITEEGERFLLANFTAEITKETRISDGIQTETNLTIRGLAANPSNPAQPQNLPEIEVTAATFPGMTWVMQQWGVRAVIQPGSGVKDDLRAAIQLRSNPETTTIYKSIGWTRIGDHPVYLHGAGGIRKDGNDHTIIVKLPPELSKYRLDGKHDLRASWAAAMRLKDLTPKPVGWALLTASLAPLYGPVDFAMHVTGRSGTYKSELTSLYQSFYGADMDARHLPGSWSSTGNALEAQAFMAANAVFVIDDFVPQGTSWQVRTLQATADKIIRAQGNQAGRARLTDTSGLQQTYYPRGIILSTGEDTPEGHSVRARMMIAELSPGDIEPKKLTECQKDRKALPGLVVGIIQDLCVNAPSITEEVEEERNGMLDIGHTRTPPMVARLSVTGSHVIKWAVRNDIITQAEANKIGLEMGESLMTLAREQQRYLETADPVEIFIGGIRQALSAGHAHARTLSGGIPLRPTVLGWTEERGSSEMPVYKSHGPCIAWVDWDNDSFYLEVNAGYAAAKKMIGQELALTKQTLLKRLKDAGALTRFDEARQRNTVRVTAEGHARQVVSLAASHVLDSQEAPINE